MKIFLRFIVILVTLSLNSAFVLADSSVGQVIKATGSSTAQRLNNVYPLGKQDPLFWKDQITTYGPARLEIIFKDKTRLQLGDHSIISIDEMVYEPNKQGRAVFSLSQGIFRMVTGAINKVNAGSLTLKTPIATIGVRGTDFWGHQTEKRLIMALLDEGILDITTPTGQVTLTKPRSAIIIEAGEKMGEIFQLSLEEVEQAKGTVQ